MTSSSIKPFAMYENPARVSFARIQFVSVCAGVIALSACSDSGNNGTGSTAGSTTGGATLTPGTQGGGGLGETGGASDTGGGRSSLGGTVAVSGGAAATGGSPSSGGVSPIGGTVATGGTVSTGGTTAKGGASATGGTTAKGGASATGGTTATGGSTAKGGAPATGGATAAGGTKATGGTGSSGGSSVTCSTTFNNPVIWEDLPDIEILRVNDTYYYTASTFHNSPGAPVLRSYDLVHWEYLSHSVPVLDFDASYDLTNGMRSYVNGIWASSLVYRKSNNTFYWYGCMHNVGGGAMFTATSPTGPWTKHKTNFCYYDVGLLVDDDDKMYAAYGNNQINVAQINPDTFTQISTKKILDSPADVGTLEGSHFLKKDNYYYVFSTQYANGDYVMRSTTGPLGTYELKPFAAKLPYAGVGSGSSPHQGNVFNTQNGDWYYMAFNDSYPAGRVPVMIPVTWSADGWPSVTLIGGKWGASYPFPNLPCGADKVRSRYGKDTFSSTTLEPWWEWNHNPDNTKWSAGSGLTLQTATVTTDPFAARNTLTRRMPGPTSTGTIELDFSSMKDGDVAGLAAWRDTSSFIVVKRTAGSSKVVLVSNATLDASWKTSSIGMDGASAAISGTKIWLRIKANVRTDAGGGTATFFYSMDGTTFTQLGGAFTMKKDWTYFLGYRYAILNYASAALGGSVQVASFDLVTP